MVVKEAVADRRAPLNRERVLRAAVELADREGIDALSMRRLGQELSVEAMSLYNHVANKDEVLNGMVDAVVGEVDLSIEGGDGDPGADDPADVERVPEPHGRDGAGGPRQRVGGGQRLRRPVRVRVRHR